MNREEAGLLTGVASAAYDRPAPDGCADVWTEVLADLPFGLARLAVKEWINTSPYWPRPADIRERARLIQAQHQREQAKRRQIADRSRYALEATASDRARQRTGANMVRHVLGRLKDAGQDVAEGKLLGRDRAGAVAEAACAEWLDRTDPGPAVPARYETDRYDGPQTACRGCYAPHDGPPDSLCPSCARCAKTIPQRPKETTRD